MNTEGSKGREIHGRAENAREKEQDFLKALLLTDEATLAYQKEKDYYGMSEVQGSRFNVFKHLYQKTGDRMFLILARHAAEQAVELAEASGEITNLGLPYRDLGKAYMELEEYHKASEALKKSLKIMTENPSKLHDSDGLRAEIQSHLGEALFFSGEKEEGLRNLYDSAKILEAQERTYEIDVWLSGTYMRLALVLYERDKSKSEEYLAKAKEIIDSNNELVLRKQQWEKLNEKLAS